MANTAKLVFDIPELLEKILDYFAISHLNGNPSNEYKWSPSIELFVLQRVSKRFQAVIQGSVILKRKMRLVFNERVGGLDLLSQILPATYSPWHKFPSIARIRNAVFNRIDSNGYRPRLIGSSYTAITYLGSAYPGTPRLSNDDNSFSKTRRSRPGSPSWQQMKLTHQPRTVHIYLRVASRDPYTFEPFEKWEELYRTVIVLDTTQETLGTFVKKLDHLLNHRPNIARYRYMKSQVSGLRESGWAPGVHLDRLRLVKVKHDQAVDCGRRYGRCAFCYYATGFELRDVYDVEGYGDETLKKVFAEL